MSHPLRRFRRRGERPQPLRWTQEARWEYVDCEEALAMLSQQVASPLPAQAVRELERLERLLSTEREALVQSWHQQGLGDDGPDVGEVPWWDQAIATVRRRGWLTRMGIEVTGLTEDGLLIVRPTRASSGS